MMNKVKIDHIFSYLDQLFPEAGCELNYVRDYELLLAVMLSAQTTDASVNKVTAVLFARYPSLEALHLAPYQDIESVIQTIGLYKTKAKHLKGIVATLLTEFDSKVPMEKELLMTLPGVGIKTANVVRAELFHIPEIAVDTHVSRIAKRLGFAKSGDAVETIEKKLRRALDASQYIKAHHQMIHFGRYFCKAKQPRCRDCQLVQICGEKHKNL